MDGRSGPSPPWRAVPDASQSYTSRPVPVPGQISPPGTVCWRGRYAGDIVRAWGMRPGHHPARRSVGVRIRAGVLLAMSAAACSSGARQPGSPFAGAALLTPLSAAEEAHDALLRADLGRADSVARRGYADGLSGL